MLTIVSFRANNEAILYLLNVLSLWQLNGSVVVTKVHRIAQCLSAREQ